MKKFETKRGTLTIRGKMYGQTEGKKPTVVLSHGFMANSSMCKDYARLLAELGYLAFTFDFCGGSIIGKSDGKTTDMSVLTEMEDLRAVIRYVSSLNYVDENRISLLGCSQGGFVSAMVAADIPEQIDKLVLLYPAFCIPDDARKGHMMFAKFDPDNIPDKLWCGPMRLGRGYAEAVIKMDPSAEIRGFMGPVLYLQGTEDKIVSTQYARQAKKEYPDCRYIEIQGGGHMFRRKYDQEAKNHIRAFFGQGTTE